MIKVGQIWGKGGVSLFTVTEIEDTMAYGQLLLVAENKAIKYGIKLKTLEAEHKLMQDVTKIKVYIYSDGWNYKTSPYVLENEVCLAVLEGQLGQGLN